MKRIIYVRYLFAPYLGTSMNQDIMFSLVSSLIFGRFMWPEPYVNSTSTFAWALLGKVASIISKIRSLTKHPPVIIKIRNISRIRVIKMSMFLSFFLKLNKAIYLYQKKKKIVLESYYSKFRFIKTSLKYEKWIKKNIQNGGPTFEEGVWMLCMTFECNFFFYFWLWM